MGLVEGILVKGWIRWLVGVGTTDLFSSISGNLIHILPPPWKFLAFGNFRKNSYYNAVLSYKNCIID